MAVNTKFITFVNNMKVCDELLMESILNAYNLIYESSENVVNSIEARLGKNNINNPLDSDIQSEDIESDEAINELYTEPPMEQPPVEEQIEEPIEEEQPLE